MESRINKRTGFPMAKHSSIERSTQTLELVKSQTHYGKDELLQLAQQSINKNGANSALERYSGQIFELIAVEGELAYKKGDWDIAEYKLLSVLPYNPVFAENLGIMYRKEKRFKDEISVLALAIQEWKSSVFNIYNGSTDDLEVRLSKAKHYFEKHKNLDNSKGIDPEFLPYDKELVQKLLDIRSKKPE